MQVSDLLDRLEHRPECDALAIGQATAAANGRSLRQIAEELLDEP